MDCSLLLSLSFFKDFFFKFTFIKLFVVVAWFYRCCIFFFFFPRFSLSLLGPLGFWHLALPVGVCSLECDNNDNRLHRVSEGSSGRIRSIGIAERKINRSRTKVFGFISRRTSYRTITANK